MKTAIKKALAGLLIVPMLVLGVSVITTPSTASADTKQQIDSGIAATGQTGAGGDLNSIFKNVVNVLLYVIGALSVIMLIFGGIRYAVSGGNSGQVTSAKNTIMYALIGLVIAVLAYAIVNFVLTSVTTSS